MLDRFPLLLILLIFVSLGDCRDVAYATDESGAHPLENGNLTEYNGSKIINFSAFGYGHHIFCNNESARITESITSEIELKIDKDNQDIRDVALVLIGNRSGQNRIDQICSIYDRLAYNWLDVSDEKGKETLQYANYTLKMGILSERPSSEFDDSTYSKIKNIFGIQKDGYLGKGDCDDFSILLASLIESIGGTSRIIFAYGPDKGHAYNQVYLGKLEGNESDAYLMVEWLKSTYNTKNITYLINFDNGDVWLNMDYWKDSEGKKHPGGPMFDAPDHILVYPRSDKGKTFLNPVNSLPIADFAFSPSEPNQWDEITFDASSSRDVGKNGKISKYQWDFGDGSKAENMVKVNHHYSLGGEYNVRLAVTDNDDANNYIYKKVIINYIPIANIDFEPEEPIIKDQKIVFDGTLSKDLDGRISEYKWDFGDRSYSNNALEQKIYSNDGNKTVYLTVKDDRGAENTTSLNISIWEIEAKINNIKNFTYVPGNLTILGDLIPGKLDRDIWIFVKPSREEIYIPQLGNSSRNNGAIKIDNRFETRIQVGKENDTNSVFDIIVALANEQASQYIDLWSENNKDKGFTKLPDGATEASRINVIRNNERFDKAPGLKKINASIRGEITKINDRNGTMIVDKTSLSKGYDLVDNYTIVHGFISPGVKNIWVLIYSSNGRWYPQSNSLNISDHVKNCYFDSPSEWHSELWFGGKSDDEYCVVAVLADRDADKFFNDFQIACSEKINYKGEKGDYPGLMTIELPQGIEEIDRINVTQR